MQDEKGGAPLGKFAWIEDNMQAFLDMLPFAKALGMRIEAVGDGKARVSLPWAPELVGDAGTGVVHGGVISALMDTCSGAAVFTHASRPKSAATLDLRIDYMRPAHKGKLITASAECYHVTRSVAFVRVTATDDRTDPPIATGAGTFALEMRNG